MNALILVDLQNDFVEGGALAVPGGKELIPLVNRLQKQFDLVVATQDWHPDDHGSFADNHPDKRPGDVAHLNGIQQTLWPAHCVQNSHGADFVPGLNRDRWTAVFQKGILTGIDSYSGFFDNGKIHATGLGDFLKKRDVDQVYVLGIATDYCVKFTALDAVSLGFQTTFIEDASRGVDLQPGNVQRAIDEMEAVGVKIIKAEEILNQKGNDYVRT